MSADYYGEFARLMPSRLRAEGEFVAMMSNGTSGDINNIPFTVTRPPREPFEQSASWHRRPPTPRGSPTGRSRNTAPTRGSAWSSGRSTLKYRRPTAEQVAAAKAVLAVKDKAEIEKLPNLARHYARNVVRGGRAEETIKVTCRPSASATSPSAACRSRRSPRSASS